MGIWARFDQATASLTVVAPSAKPRLAERDLARSSCNRGDLAPGEDPRANASEGDAIS
jgi:hypothetical protein